MKISRRRRNPEETVREIYRRLSLAWGAQHWWPAETPFEVIVGAILTQNTSWTNVERAMSNLKATGMLSADAIRDLPIGELQTLVHSSGYFRQKAARLKSFVAFLDANYGGSVNAMLNAPTAHLREQLLAHKGIGPETADSMLLYAGHHPIFVVDAYTRRVLERHEAIAASAKYEEIRQLVERSLQGALPPQTDVDALAAARPQVHPPSAMSTAPRDQSAQVFNEMHGLFVQLGKHLCTKREPKCELCPLGDLLVRPVKDAPNSRAVPSKRGRKSRV